MGGSGLGAASAPGGGSALSASVSPPPPPPGPGLPVFLCPYRWFPTPVPPTFIFARCPPSVPGCVCLLLCPLCCWLGGSWEGRGGHRGGALWAVGWKRFVGWDGWISVLSVAVGGGVSCSTELAAPRGWGWGWGWGAAFHSRTGCTAEGREPQILEDASIGAGMWDCGCQKCCSASALHPQEGILCCPQECSRPRQCWRDPPCRQQGLWGSTALPSRICQLCCWR